MIIDAHSHIGKDFYFGESKLNLYDNFCINNNIDIGLLMPMPWPVYYDGELEISSLIWEHENYKKISYYKLKKDKNKVRKEKVILNPYEGINNYYYNLINDTKTKTIINFVPLIHGVLDDENYLMKLIEKMDPKAVKFHGFASGFFACDVKKEIIKVIKYYDLPIIIHTSVYKYNDGYGASTKFWRNKCSASNWIDFLIENELKGVLNHGACLDLKVIDKVNKNENIMIGIGPDLDISLDYRKVLVDKDYFLSKKYLNILKELVDPNRLLYDVDYNWNKNENNRIDNYSNIRIKNVWNDSDCEKILYKNAKKMYKL